MSGWLGGSATVSFPIPVGTALGGYADRTGPSTGTHDPLEISALVLRSGGNEAHIVTDDVVGVDGDLAGEVAATTGVDPGTLLLCATHTHSGPLGTLRRLHPATNETIDLPLRQRFVSAISEAIAGARSRMVPVTVDHGSATVSNAWTNRNDPTAPVDLRVRWLRTRRVDGTLHALMLLVPCHPTVLGAWNQEVSADLHGAVRRRLRARLPAADQDATLLAATGAAGDVSTRFARKESSFTEVDRLGEVVATAVADSFPTGTRVEPGITLVNGSAPLPMRTIDAVTARHDVDQARTALARLNADAKTTEPVRRQAHTRLQGAEIQAAMGEMAPITLEMGALCLGNTLNLVVIPGEPFTSLGTAIEAAADPQATWVVGYTNGYIGYLPDLRAYDSGTYEALASPYERHVGGEVTTLASELVNALHPGLPRKA